MKVRLKKLIQTDNPDVNDRLQDAVRRTNAIMEKAYQLLRFWLLNQYQSDTPIQPITEGTLKMAFKAIVQPTRGPKPKGENAMVFNQLRPLAQSLWTHDEDGIKLSFILGYSATTMLTAIENNIKSHFMNHVRQFANQSLKYHFQTEYLTDKKSVSKEWMTVKRDLISSTLTCDVKYHEWIQKYRSLILPPLPEMGYAYDVQVDPQKYLPFMIAMNVELERIGGKMFQFFPLQTTLTPRHITIDTTALAYLMIDEHVKDSLIELTDEHKRDIWNQFFQFPRHCRIKGHVFDYLIQTDGYMVTLQFLNEKYVASVKLLKDKMKKGRELAKTLTPEEKIQRKKIKSTSKPKSEKSPEFQYFDEVDPLELGNEHIFVDPGKRDLFTMMDDTGKFFSYSNKLRLRQTKRLKYQRLIQNHRDKTGISELETGLSTYNTKTCDVDKFKAYILARAHLREQLQPKYEDVKFRQYQWYSYLNTRRSEDTMLNQIEKTYSKDHTIILGDWSAGKSMRHFISTPNLGLRRKLASRFKVYLIDEFRTSCLHWKTEEYCENLYLPDKIGNFRKMHSILTFKMENNRLGCINRDRNSCLNMHKLFEHHKSYGVRPERYCRGLKCSNPVLSTVSNGTMLDE